MYVEWFKSNTTLKSGLKREFTFANCIVFTLHIILLCYQCVISIPNEVVTVDRYATRSCHSWQACHKKLSVLTGISLGGRAGLVVWVGGTLYATLYSKKHQSTSLDNRESNDVFQTGIVSHNDAVSKHTATILSACIHFVRTPGMPVGIIASYFSDLQHIWSVLFGNGMSVVHVVLKKTWMELRLHL